MTRTDANPPTPDPERVYLSGSPENMPKEIGGYLIHRILGAGGMAVVYAAQQQRPKRVVALKVMKTGGNPKNALHRFQREIEILGKLRHPYVAQVFDAGTHREGTEEWPYYVMEYVPGAKDILVYAHLKKLDLREKLKLFVKVCAAVEHGHRHHVIHRDLKPGNILIDNTGEPKIIDFGVARAMETEITATTQATEEGRLVGTIQYMAPEQLEARVRDVDARIDVYALGTLLYKLVTGRLPHELEGLTLYTAIQVLREESPSPPGEITPEAKGDLETIILKAIERDRTRRYRTAGSLGRDLVRQLADKPIHARRASIRYRTRLFVKRNRTPLAAVAAVAIVLLAAGGIVAYQGWDRTRSDAQAQAELDMERKAREAAEAALRNAPATVPATAPEDEREPYTLAGHRGVVTALAYSADGTRLYSGSDDRTAIMWDVGERERIDLADNHDSSISRLSISADGTRAATASGDGVIAIVDAATNRLIRILRGPCDSNTCLALGPAGTSLAFGCDDLTLRIRELETGATLTIRGTTGAFTVAAFSPDGSQVVAGSQHGTVYVADAAGGAIIHRLQGLDDEVLLVGHSGGDDERIVAIDRSGRGQVWNLAAGLESTDAQRGFVIARDTMTQAALDPTGRLLAAASGQTLHLFDLETLRPVGEPIEHERMIYSIAIPPDRAWYALGDAIGEVTVYPIKEGRPGRGSEGAAR